MPVPPSAMLVVVVVVVDAMSSLLGLMPASSLLSLFSVWDPAVC